MHVEQQSPQIDEFQKMSLGFKVFLITQSLEFLITSATKSKRNFQMSFLVWLSRQIQLYWHDLIEKFPPLIN